MLGNFLTVPEGDFTKLLRSANVVEDSDTRREAYRYAMVSELLVVWNHSFLSHAVLLWFMVKHSPVGLSCVLSLIVLTLDYPEPAFSTSRPMLLCLYG